ncbi:transporter substrate-binding domain-containing protein [Mesorhizobium sp.]|uniref:transporter substrate-binding domain-containing protein n=1 Tax=Mesorhizobium sp. TaxID=1871066 RepID=UPI0025800BF1|nr:transporter substrate-binding domain-containing protein [Mesorhizobium sp.]
MPVLAHSQDAQRVNFGIEGDFPPWSSVDSKGEPSGLAIDLIRDFCRREKFDCVINVVSWDSLIPSLTGGKFDAIMNIGINEKRKEVIGFSLPYVISPASFITLKTGTLPSLPDTGTPINVEDKAAAGPILQQLKGILSGKTVGVVRSTSHEQMINAFFGDVTTVRTYPTAPERDLDIKAGRIDIGFDNAVYGASELAKSGNGDLSLSGPLFDGAPLATQVAIG